MKEENDPSCERFYTTFAKESYPLLQYMRPQFRFLVYYGRKNPRVNLVENLDRFFHDTEKVVSGDTSVWGEPVVIDGVPVLPVKAEPVIYIETGGKDSLHFDPNVIFRGLGEGDS